jgi:hypothetical protein
VVYRPGMHQTRSSSIWFRAAEWGEPIESVLILNLGYEHLLAAQGFGEVVNHIPYALYIIIND